MTVRLVACLGLSLCASGCGPAPAPGRVERELGVFEREESAERLLARGRAFARVGDMTRAEQYFAAALEAGGDPDVVLPLLLRACVAEKRFRVALDYAERQLKKRPRDARLRYVVATLYASIGDPEAAKRELTVALQDDPDNAGAHFALAVIHRDEDGDLVGADRHFRAYLRLEPRGPHAEEALGSLLKDVPAPPRAPTPEATAPPPVAEPIPGAP